MLRRLMVAVSIGMAVQTCAFVWVLKPGDETGALILSAIIGVGVGHTLAVWNRAVAAASADAAVVRGNRIIDPDDDDVPPGPPAEQS